MLVSAIPQKVAVPWAVSGLKNSIPDASQISVTPGAASFTDGFPPLTMTSLAAGGVPPAGQDMNGVLYTLSLIQRWQQAGGQFPYDAAFSTAVSGYPRNALLQKADGSGTWRSLVDNNTSNPDTGGANWEDSNARRGSVVGMMRNGKMSVPAVSASATFTADEVVTETVLGGPAFRLATFAQTVNLGTVGAGGMDTGAAPVSGFVALYAIYNPIANTRALLAVNATAAVAPEVYGGANMPSGYTASALLSVWPTNASSQFQIAYQIDRRIFRASQTVFSTVGQQASLTALSVSVAVPRNARSAWGNVNANINTPTSLFSSIAGSSTGVGLSILAITQTGSASQGATIPFPETPILTLQTLFYTVTVAGGSSLNYDISVTGYSI